VYARPADEYSDSDILCWCVQDEIYDYFVQHGHFAGTLHHVPRRLHDLVTWCVWALLLCLPLFYYATGILISSSLTTKLAVSAAVAIGQIRTHTHRFTGTVAATLGYLLKFEISPGNSGNLLEFSLYSWKIYN